jgi:hypothetical protein
MRLCVIAVTFFAAIAALQADGSLQAAAPVRFRTKSGLAAQALRAKQVRTAYLSIIQRFRML